MTQYLPDSSAERTIRIVTLYPEVMNVYSDRGNLIALLARCRRLGVGYELTEVGIGDVLPSGADLVLVGGGQDREQQRVARDLQVHGPMLREWVEQDVAVLAVCGGFQLFGNGYRTMSGEELPGIRIFDVVTVASGAGWERCIGDVLAESTLEDVGEVVGFENHGGRTYLGPGVSPFARVVCGYGNNGDDGSEGALNRQAIGTYLHGSVLPKNVALTDRLILAALRHRYDSAEALPAILDTYAERAHGVAVEIARRRSRRA